MTHRIRNIVEFRGVTSLAKNEWIFLAKHNMNVLPVANTIVNINGTPYLIHNIALALSNEDPYTTYVYVYVITYVG